MAYAEATIEAPEAGLATDAPHEELYRIGLLYATGMGVPTDYVAAHKWFNLAALRGNADARLQRKEMADYMSTEEIREAQRTAREWLDRAN